jgi:predicted Zn-dependent protease
MAGTGLQSSVTQFRVCAIVSVKLRGSLGQGYLYGVANQINGTWEYSRLAFVAETGVPRVDLNKNPPPLQLPPVPAQKLYLIPIGLAENEPLDWAPQYYQAKFGIEVILLSRAELDSSLENPQRHQLNSSKCIDFLRHLRPDLASDPSAMLIGITSREMYIPDFDWAYAENWRYGGHFAIVSSARLHPPSPMGEWNPEWLNSRVQKLLTKNIAMLYFGLPLSSDDTSMLGGAVSSGMAIDRMGGQVIGADGAWDSFINSGDPGFAVEVRFNPGIEQPARHLGEGQLARLRLRQYLVHHIVVHDCSLLGWNLMQTDPIHKFFLWGAGHRAWPLIDGGFFPCAQREFGVAYSARWFPPAGHRYSKEFLQ